MSTKFDNKYVLDVLSDDHPGIVAAVGTAVEQLGGNIDACSQTVIGGYFTLIMIVSFPEAVDPTKIIEMVHESHPGGSDLQVVARELVPTQWEKTPHEVETFVVTCSGADRPGVVLHFSRYLAGKDINIVDLYGERSGDSFVLISQVEVPAKWDIGMLQAELEEMGKELEFTVRLQHENIFVATNQLRLPH